MILRGRQPAAAVAAAVFALAAAGYAAAGPSSIFRAPNRPSVTPPCPSAHSHSWKCDTQAADPAKAGDEHGKPDPTPAKKK
jgi:hypothetical protein